MRSMMEATILASILSAAVSISVLTWLPRVCSHRHAGASGFAAGLTVAFAFAFGKHISPSTYWHWLPWIVVVAGIIGPIGLASGVTMGERWLMSAVLTLVAGFLLVPTRPSLLSIRLTYVLMFALTIWLLWGLADALATTRDVSLLGVILGCMTLNSGSIVAYSYSLTIGFLGLAAFASLTGGLVAFAWRRDSLIIRGMLASQFLATGGVLLAALVNDGLNYAAVGLILVSPLMLLLFQIPAISRNRLISHWMAKISLALAPQFWAWWISI